jgi:lipopolysaccharide export system permease protein
MIGLGRLERYVLRQHHGRRVGALAVITGVIMLVEFVDISRNVGVRSDDAGFGALLFLTLLKAPATILALAPVRLPVRHPGRLREPQPPQRADRHARGGRLGLAVHPAGGDGGRADRRHHGHRPQPADHLADRKFETQRTALMEGYLANSDKPSWLRQGDDNTQIVIRATRRDRVDDTIRLRGVSLFVFTRGANGALEFSRRIEASEARLVSGFWRLTNVREALPGAGSLSSEACRSPRPSTRGPPPNASTPRAPSRLLAPAGRHRAHRAGRLLGHALPPAPAAAVRHAPALCGHVDPGGRLLAAPDAPGRPGGPGRLGRGLGFVIFFFNQLCEALGKSDVIFPFAAAWAPPVLALLAGFTLLCYTEDG